MARNVYCQLLQREARGFNAPPYPGELGQRIYDNISQEGWQQWLQRLSAIINENRLSTADPKSLEVIELHMRGFLFGEGNLGQLPAGFTQQGKGK